ncbi:MAG: hypothetical protein ABI758_04780 [Candidatus Woesebacteria bacterium]
MTRKKQKTSSLPLLFIILIVIATIATAKVFHTLSIQPSATPVPEIAIPFDFSSQKTGQTTGIITHQTVNASQTRAGAILVDDSSGSGTFYSVIGVMQTNGTEVYSQPILIGDRVQIVSLMVNDPGAHDNGLITVTYLDRAKNAPMTTQPTKKMIIQYAFEDNGNLIPVKQ